MEIWKIIGFYFHPILIKLHVYHSYKLFMVFETIIKFIKTLGKLFAVGELFISNLICGIDIWDGWLNLRK